MMRYLRLFLLPAIMLAAMPGLLYGTTQGTTPENPSSLTGSLPTIPATIGTVPTLGVDGKAVGLYCSVKDVCVIAANPEDCKTIGGAKVEASKCNRASAPKVK